MNKKDYYSVGIPLLYIVITMFVFLVSGGCTSITDANEPEPTEIVESNGDDMDPIIRRPTSGGTYYD